MPIAIKGETGSHIRRRMIDFGLYIAIGAAVIIVLLASTGKLSHEAFVRWGGLCLNTLALFGLFLGKSRDYIRNRSFWKFTAILLSVHLIVFAIVLINVEEWRLTWFMVMIFEYPLFLFLRGKFLNIEQD